MMILRKLHFSLWLSLFTVFTLSITSCQDEKNENINAEYRPAYAFDHTVATTWNDVMVRLERFTDGYRAPVAARSAAFINLAAYESIVPGMADEYNSIATLELGYNLPKISATESYYWPLVMNSCYRTALQKFYPSAPSELQQLIITTFESIVNQYRNEVDAASINRSIEYGKLVAEIIHAYAQEDYIGDKANEKLYDPNYIAPVGEGLWNPSSTSVGQALLPNWGNVKTFFAESSDFVIRAPLAFSTDPSSPLYTQALEVKELVENIHSNPNDRNRWVAEFWSDDCPQLTFTPAGRWVSITQQAIIKKQLNLADAAVLFAQVSMALHDASVGTWKLKYAYNILRPTEYIRQVMLDENWNTLMCPDADGRTSTPPTPSFPSEHAAYGQATAGILLRTIGSGFSMTDKCHEGRTEFLSTPRTFSNFQDMSNENAYSRLPLGVHFKMDVIGGQELGDKIYKRIMRIPFKK